MALFNHSVNVYRHSQGTSDGQGGVTRTPDLLYSSVSGNVTSASAQDLAKMQGNVGIWQKKFATKDSRIQLNDRIRFNGDDYRVVDRINAGGRSVIYIYHLELIT